MAIADLIDQIMPGSSVLADEAFGDGIASTQFVESKGQKIHEVTDLFGKKVAVSGMLDDLLMAVNGGANIVFADRWVSTDEMESPFGEAAKCVEQFDPLTTRQTAHDSFFNSLEDEIYAYQEASGIEPTGTMSGDEKLVLFSYNLVELGSRPTYLYFGNQSLEPVVWSSAIDWTQIYGNLEEFLKAHLE